jgi:PleD family two-component response regulator
MSGASQPIVHTMDEAATDHPVVLIATEGEWAARSLESVLSAQGYEVLRAVDGHDAYSFARKIRPDAVILDENLSGLGGIEVCKLLRDDARFDAATPIVITASAPTSRNVRTEAYAAGAWEFCTHPVDTEALKFTLGTYIRAKRALEEARKQAMLDHSTGVLSPLGMERWAEQLAARASRNHEPLACIVLMPVSASAKKDTITSSVENVNREVEQFLSLSRNAFRRSDIVGRMEDGRVALLAPDTDDAGVHGLLARLRSAVEAAYITQNADSETASPEFQAGYWAVRDFSSAPLEPAELMRRAAKALDHINNRREGDLAIGFDQLPLS